MEIRTEEQLVPYGEEFRRAWLQTFGEEVEPEEMIDVYEFFTYMAESEGLTFQNIPQPIRHFAEKPNEVKNSADLGFFVGRYLEAIREHSGSESYSDYMWDPIIGGFVGYMAEKRGFILKNAQKPIRDFRPHLH